MPWLGYPQLRASTLPGAFIGIKGGGGGEPCSLAIQQPCSLPRTHRERERMASKLCSHSAVFIMQFGSAKRKWLPELVRGLVKHAYPTLSTTWSSVGPRMQVLESPRVC